MIYYPELGEQAAKRIFRTRHVHGEHYGLEWLPADNEEALAIFKRLRIKPKNLRFQRVGHELVPEAKSDKWACGVTSRAHDKLMDADLCAHEMLLD